VFVFHLLSTIKVLNSYKYERFGWYETGILKKSETVNFPMFIIGILLHIVDLGRIPTISIDGTYYFIFVGVANKIIFQIAEVG
jgi:hypothetical protein